MAPGNPVVQLNKKHGLPPSHISGAHRHSNTQEWNQRNLHGQGNLSGASPNPDYKLVARNLLIAHQSGPNTDTQVQIAVPGLESVAPGFKDEKPLVETQNAGPSLVMQMYEYERGALDAFNHGDYEHASSLFKIADGLAQKAKISGAAPWQDANHFSSRMLDYEFSCYEKMVEASYQKGVAKPALSIPQFNRAIRVLTQLDGEGEMAAFTRLVFERPKCHAPFVGLMHRCAKAALDAHSREKFSAAALLFKKAVELAQGAQKYGQLPWQDMDYFQRIMLNHELSCYCGITEKSYAGSLRNPVLSGTQLVRAIKVLELLDGGGEVEHFLRLADQSYNVRMERVGRESAKAAKKARTGQRKSAGANAHPKPDAPAEQLVPVGSNAA